MPLHFIVSVLPVTIFLGWYNLFMFSLDFFIFSFEYQTPMLYPQNLFKIAMYFAIFTKIFHNFAFL